MSHDITNPLEAIFHLRPAWHYLGTVFTKEKMRTLDVAGTCPGIFVRRYKTPVYLGNGDEIKDRYAVVREDNMHVHGIVTGQYRVWQVSEAADFMDSLVDDGVCYESAFSLRGGDIVVLQAKMPYGFAVGRDTTVYYLTVKIPFTGKDAVLIIPTRIRVVCANTLAMAERSGMVTAIRHNWSLEEKLKAVRDMLLGVESEVAVDRQNADILASNTMTEDEMQAFLSEMFPKKKQIRAVRNAWHEERSSFRDMGESRMIGSRWHMLNAITRAADHGSLINRRGDERSKAERRWEDAVDGTSAKIKSKAERLLLV
jgi:phage/plasmid-like protein (TIGR03299 family)